MCIEKITKLVFNKTGIDVKSIGLSAFSCATQLRIETTGSQDINQYYSLLINNNDEFNALIEEIIVPETWFFRDPHACLALVKHLKHFPTSTKPFKILSLPSSSGEEAYSIAISLLENNISHESFSIDAIDISQKNIDTAIIGKYRNNSFRSEISDRILDKYFTRKGSELTIATEIKDCIYFLQGNIFDANTLNTQSEYDAIFCRNMLIYFNKEKKTQALNKITYALKDNGLLLIGHSETGLLPTSQYKPSDIKKSFAFTRQLKPAEKPAIQATRDIRPTSAAKSENLRKSHAPVSIQKTTPPEKSTMTKPDLEMAKKAANSGALDNALKMCLEIESCNATSNSYALCGSILTAMNRLQDAEKKFRKAIFLDPHHHDSLLQLALLMEKKGDMKNATLLKKRAHKYQAESL